MRHAQEYWLRLQAEEALKLAADVEPDMFGLKCEFKDLRSMHIDSTDIALKAMHHHALEEAARLLVRAEMIHRAIASNGGTE